jgi:hypothetical protein
MSVPKVEELKPLNKILIPGNPNPSTRWRLATKGVSGVDGERIKLQCWYVSNHPFTTDEAVSDFLTRCTAVQEVKAQRRSARNADVTSAEMAEVGL